MLGERIKSEMEKAGLDVEALSTKTDISTSTIYRIFGKDNCEIAQLKRISEALNLPFSYFLDEKLENNEKRVSSKDKTENFYDKLLSERERIIAEKERQIEDLRNDKSNLQKEKSNLQEELKSYQDLVKNQFKEKFSSTLGKNSELEHSQPSTPTGQAFKSEGETAPAGK